MRIRMKISVSGTFHNATDGVCAGDIVDVDDEDGRRYVQLGYAEAVKSPPPEERAVLPDAETAVTTRTEPKPRGPKPSA